jgi:exodeoxyribonuclease-3
MKLITLNCNGVRSAFKKGLDQYLKKEKADFIALQEIKAEEKDMDISFFEKLGYTHYINSAEKKGYSGVAIFTKEKVKEAIYGVGDDFFDKEGRSILLVTKQFAFVNTYFPSGTSGEERQALKMKFLDHYLSKKKEWEDKYKKLIICGDVNIAHTPMDIHNPKGNEKNSGYLPEEREWLTGFLETGLVDAFRLANPKSVEYSWWSHRFNSRAQNKGWRIDYFFLTKNLSSKIKSVQIENDLIVSDHTAVKLNLNL